MASIYKKIIEFYCVLFLINCVQSTYISYYIQYYCEQHPDRRILISDEGSYSALILRSSNGQTISNQKCKVKIIGQHIAGFIVTVGHVSLQSNDCDNYIKLDNNTKWCHQKQVSNVSVNKNEMLIEFGTGNNSSAEFELIITTFTGLWNKTCPNANNIRCHGGKQECIYNGLECDGYSNCQSGSDEKECPTFTTLLNDENFGEDSQDSENSSDIITQKSKAIETIITNSTTYLNISSTSTERVLSTNASTFVSTTTNFTQVTSNDTDSKPTDKSTTSGRTTISTTTQTPSHTTSKHNEKVSGGETAALIIGIILLTILVGISFIYVYRKQANNQDILYTPL